MSAETSLKSTVATAVAIELSLAADPHMDLLKPVVPLSQMCRAEPGPNADAVALVMIPADTDKAPTNDTIKVFRIQLLMA